MRAIRSGHLFSDHYRNIPEERILDAMYLCGWIYEADEARSRIEIRQMIDDCIGLGLGVRRLDGARLFDPVEVLNFIKWIDLQHAASFWTDHHVPTARQLVEDLARRDESRKFKVEFSRTFHVSQPATSARLRMPLPLMTGGLSDLSVIPHQGLQQDIVCRISNGRLEARVAPLEAGKLTIGATLIFKADGRHHELQTSLTPDEMELYLRPREGLIHVSDRIRTLARDLAGGRPADWEVVRGFWNYILDELICGAIHYDQVWTDAPCDWVLETGWFDCQLAAALFAALCRASGIPARLVGGHMLYQKSPTIHYWAEVWLEGKGWVPADFLAWDLSRGGRDQQWRDSFFGSLEPRMITQVMPLAFTGAVGITMPDEFVVMQTMNKSSVDIALMSTCGEICYVDTLIIVE
jgi:hypothetical protein